MSPRLRLPAALGLLAILALAALLALSAPALQRGWRALELLRDLQAGVDTSDSPAHTAIPQRIAADFTVDGRHHRADRYLPAEEQPRATLVLLHGLTPEGRREPRLVHFADTLARAGFAVLVPELPGMRSLSMGITDARDITDALRHALNARDDCSAVGELAVSFAVGPALLAALAPEVRERLAFVVAVGGYYDLGAAITYATTGFDPLAQRAGRPPAPEGRWWLLQSQSGRLDDPMDRRLVRTVAQRKLRDPDAAIDDLVSELGPSGRALYSLVANTDPKRVPGLIQAQPPSVRRELEALDLTARDLDALRARVVLIHGTEDAVIPVSHSQALQQRLGPGRAWLFETGGLQHVDVSPGLTEGWALWRAVYALLALADEASPSC